MPEGPEIRRAADAIAEHIVDQRLINVVFAHDHLKQYEQQLIGKKVVSVVPHGKALLTEFSNGLILYSHNQLYGVWKLAAAGKRPNSQRSLRVALESKVGGAYLYSASDIEMHDKKSIRLHPFLTKLGPDILDSSISTDAINERLQEKRFVQKKLSGLLLDQAFLAGMGNYLRSEVLFNAKLSALRTAKSLNADERLLLAESLIEIPMLSYLTRKKTLSKEAENYRGKKFRFEVFDREGKPCRRCKRAIERIEAAGRRWYFCPHCQA